MKRIIIKINTKFKNYWIDRINKIKISRIIKAACSKKMPNLKILFGPGFNINKGFTYHDILLAAALKYKGADIHYMSCQHMFRACTIFGGVWKYGQSKEEDCNFCISCDKEAGKLFSKFAESSRLSDFVSEKKLNEIEILAANMRGDNLITYVYKGINVGHAAMNTVRNLFMVSDVRLVDAWEKHVKDNLVTNIAFVDYYNNVIEEFKPDRIISHDAFYSPWSMLFEIANKKNILFYNYYLGLRRGTWLYVKNSIAMYLDMSQIWDRIKDKPLEKTSRERIAKLLKDRESGNINLMKQFRDKYSRQEYHLLEKFKNSGKPTAVLYTNVVWDLAALEKETIYQTIKEAYIDTIKYFMNHSEYQLIIKTHPDEENPIIPKTVEQVHNIIEKEFPYLPANIMLLKTRSMISAYDLFKFIKLTIVYTTTTGLESVIYKVPTITLGNVHYRDKGFTIDPVGKKEYYEKIEQILLVDYAQDKLSVQSELALKYFFYFQYALFIDTDMVSLSFDGKPIVVHPKTAYDLLKNQELQNVIDNMIAGKDIIPLRLKNLKS